MKNMAKFLRAAVVTLSMLGSLDAASQDVTANAKKAVLIRSLQKLIKQLPIDAAAARSGHMMHRQSGDNNKKRAIAPGLADKLADLNNSLDAAKRGALVDAQAYMSDPTVASLAQTLQKIATDITAEYTGVSQSSEGQAIQVDVVETAKQ
jgi:hypothetical protein